MSIVSRPPVQVLLGQDGPEPSTSPTSSAEDAAVAAAEAIAAAAAADIAVEAVGTAEAMVRAATSAAAEAAARTRHSTAVASAVAAQAAVAISYEAAATADAAVVAATAAAAEAADMASHCAAESSAAETAAEIAAQAAATAAAMVLAAKAAAARVMVQARRTAQAAADVAGRAAADMAAEAAATAEAMVVAATEAAAETMAVAAAVAEAAVRSERDGLVATALSADTGPGARGSAIDDDGLGDDRPAEGVACHAEPLLPLFPSARDTGIEGHPGESGRSRDTALAGRTPDALTATEASFETVFDCAPTALLVASLVDGRPGELVRVNQAFSELTGWPAVRLLGAVFADLAHPHERAMDEQDLVVTHGHAEVTQVQRWAHADGGGIWVRLRLVAMPTSARLTVQQLVCHVERLGGDVPGDPCTTSHPGDEVDIERLLARADERDRSAEVRDRVAEARDSTALVRERMEGGTTDDVESSANSLARSRAAIDRLHGGRDRDWGAVDREALIAALRSGAARQRFV